MTRWRTRSLLTLAALIQIALAARSAGAVDLDCLIAPYVSVSVTTQAVGILETVTVDRGDLVAEGQVLATLESSVERAAVAANSARSDLSNRRLAELELNRSIAELNQRTLRSPITGVVVKRFLHPGEFVNRNPILELAQLDPLRVEVFAPISLLSKLAVGMRAQVMPEAPVGGTHAARVTVVDRVVDAASSTFGVRLELPNPNYRLPAGLKCRVRF